MSKNMTRMMAGITNLKGTISRAAKKFDCDNWGDWFKEFGKFLQKKPCWVDEGVCLRRIGKHDKFIIPACDGSRTFIKVRTDVGVHTETPSLHDLDNKLFATKETHVNLYQVTKTETLDRFFTSLSFDLDALVLTEHQILCFCEKYPYPLHYSVMSTFFLFKRGDSFFVAKAYTSTYDASLFKVDVFPLDAALLWHDFKRYRLVAPKGVGRIE